MPFKAAPIALDDKTRSDLQRRVRAGTCEQREAKRARIILLAAEGMSSRKISKEVGMHESHVAMWPCGASGSWLTALTGWSTLLVRGRR